MKKTLIGIVMLILLPAFVSAANYYVAKDGSGDIPGDLNNDEVVDIHDLTIVTSHFGLTSNDANWDPRADVADPKGVIDIFDVVFITRRIT